MPMKDGYRTLILFPDKAAVLRADFAEVTIKPPGLDGRGPIDITSMRNNSYTTKWPKSLRDFTNIEATVQWNPIFLFQINTNVLLINQNIDVQFPNLNRIRVFGWADKFEPQVHKEGEVPLADLTLIQSNLNNADPNVETGPQFFAN